MKTINIFLIAVLCSLSLVSCDYLDIVPDESTTEADTYADMTHAREFLYSCYSYLPNHTLTSSGLDFMTGDEVVTAFEHETFASFPKGNYSASSTVISYWDTFFTGLRQIYTLRNHLGDVPDMNESTRTDYEGQLEFLIAYYHYLLIRCYGPTILIKELPNVNTTAENYAHREHLDTCVNFVVAKCDAAADKLPASRSQENYGLATSVAAKTLKAEMLLLAASPLFNPSTELYNAYYSDFKDPVTGESLMPTTYDSNKWTKARDAMREAITFAESNGIKLYDTQNPYSGSSSNPYPEAGVVRCLRFAQLDFESNANPEFIWAETRGWGYYNVQNKSLPYCDAGFAWNGVAPTWTMLNRFYTINGLPWDEDPDTKDIDPLQIVTIPDTLADEGYVGKKTIRFNLLREPRFYAWVAFQGGYFEVMNNSSYPAYTMSNGQKDNTDTRLVCDFLIGGNCSRSGEGGTTMRNNNYSPTGYLNKKWCSPNTIVASNSYNGHVTNPFPIFRLADLYLGYAEACVETNDLETAITYIDKVRTRAGILGVKEAWAKVAGVTLNQSKLRQIVRQERMNEFYLERQNFWDMRRWLLAGDNPTRSGLHESDSSSPQYFNQKHKGMDITADNINEFAKLTEVSFERKFITYTHYLLPIPSADVNRNSNICNNPGY